MDKCEHNSCFIIYGLLLGSILYANNHVSISVIYIVHVGQINEILFLILLFWSAKTS